MFKRLLKLTVFLVCLGIFAVLITTVLFATASGSRWLINRVIDQNDIPVTIDRIEGRLLDKISLHGLHFLDRDGNELSADSIELDWSAMDLLGFNVNVAAIEIDQLTIKFPKSDSSTPENIKIAFPAIPVNIDKLELHHTRILNPGSEQLIEHIRARLVTSNNRLALNLEQLQSANQQLVGSATLLRKKIPEVAINLEWSGIVENSPGQGHLQLDGPQNNMDLQFTVESSSANIKAHGNLDLLNVPYGFALQGEAYGDLPQSLNNHVKHFSPLQFNLNGNTDFIEGHLVTELQLASGEKLTLDLENYVAMPGTSSQSFNINLDWKTTPEQKNPLLTLSGQGNFEYQNEKLTIDHQLAAPYSVHLTGGIDFTRRPDLDLTLAWNDIHLAVSDASALRVPSGTLDVAGTLDTLVILVKTRFAFVEKVLDNSANKVETVFSQLSMEGILDTRTGFPSGAFKGTLDGPVPVVLQKQVKQLEPLLINVDFHERIVDLTATSTGLSTNNDPFDLKLHSKLDYSQSDRDNLDADADVEWSVTPASNTSHLQLIAGHGKLHYQNDQLEVTHDLISPFSSKLDGNVTFKKEQGSILHFDINWQDLDLPLKGTAALQSKYGQVHLEGPVSALAIQVESQFQSTPLGPVDLNIKANWSDPLLKFESIDLKALGGNTQGKGQLVLEGITRGQFELNTHNINLESINPDLVSKIDLSTHFNFSLEKDGLNGQLQIPMLSGDWRGHPVQGNAEISGKTDQVHIKTLHVESGTNTIDMQLNMHQTLTGFIELSITDMSIFSSELAGTVNGRVDIGGTTQALLMDGQFMGNDIAAFDLRIGSIKADSQIDLGPQQKSSLEIRSKKFQYRDWLYDEVTVTGKGVTESHILELVASSNNLQVSAQLDGQLYKKDWQVTINQLEFKAPQTGEWKLARPADIRWQVASNRFTVTDTCIEQKNARLCLQSSGDVQNNVSAAIQLHQLPMALAQPWLPDTLSLDGAISGDVLLNHRNDRWDIQTSVEGTGTRINVGYAEDTDTLEVPQITLKAEVTHNKREWNLQLRSPEYFDIELDGSVLNTEVRPLSVNMKADLYQIDWLAGINPALTGSKGKFEVRLQASGTVNQPQLQGEFNLRNGQLTILPVGLNLDHISGKLDSGSDRKQILISSLWGSNSKQLAIKGHVSLDVNGDYPYQFLLQGEEFPLVRTADFTMDVSPDIDLQGSLQQHNIRGHVVVPLLKMQVTNLPENTVNVSPDTVIIQSKTADVDPVEASGQVSDFIRNQLDIDVNLNLGPDIHIQGFGLNTKIAGELNMVKPAGIYQPRGEGFVKIREGSYRAYGQNLVIEKGQLHFSGPLDNPGINLYAYRPNLKVRPGVKVTGNIRQPKLSMYSSPALSDGDTLSYLITGRPLTGVSSSEDANLLAQAALALGTQESSVLTNQIESMFGLEEFSVGTGDTYQSTSLNATKRLSPNLTFSPSFNPFDQVWTFLLNYRLTDHWSIQAESGTSQGGDIIYSIDTNKMSELFKNIWNFRD